MRCPRARRLFDLSGLDVLGAIDLHCTQARVQITAPAPRDPHTTRTMMNDSPNLDGRTKGPVVVGYAGAGIEI